MPNYKNGKIYSIRCRIDDALIYIGSTTQSLAKRWGDHKFDFKTGNHLPYHKLIIDIKDWYIQLEEEFPCDNKEQLEKREFEIMRNISTLNRTLKYYDEFENPSKLHNRPFTRHKVSIETQL
jgi:hypothetical protein